MKASRGVLLRAALDKCIESEAIIDDAKRNLDAWKTTVGGQVRLARKEAGITLREMARRCNVSPAMLSDFEYGRRWSDRLVAELLKVLRS